MLSADEIYNELIDRGCSLRPAALQSNIVKLQRAIGGEIAEPIKEIFLRFDGFVENVADDLSQIHIWSIEKVDIFRKQKAIGAGSVIFGDRLIESDFLLSDFCFQPNPVFLFESRKKIAESYLDFWYKLLNSEYDL